MGETPVMLPLAVTSPQRKEKTMAKYLVSTTTHNDMGVQIDNWEGDYVEADSAEEAERMGVEWEEDLLILGGTNPIVEGNTLLYWDEDTERDVFKVVHVDEA